MSLNPTEGSKAAPALDVNTSSTPNGGETAASPRNAGGPRTRMIGEPIEDLQEHIKFLSEPSPHAPEYNGFDIEFNFIEKRTMQPDFQKDFSGASLPVNRSKNRYTNVLPPEETRVPLSPIANIEGSDYINGNFIAGECNGDMTYISTQGPLSNTTCDFWRMVWEHKSSVCVMLTREVESGRLKCNRYWPEGGSLVFDDIRVTLTDKNEDIDDLVIRNFEVTHTQTNMTRDLTHFQYTGWPDHGLPESVSAFLLLVSMVDQANSPRGPIIVHCSAGIGRSGTFCAVHSLIHMMRNHVKQHNKLPLINVVGTVLDLRDQRPGMVQTKEQYMFCYLALLKEYDLLKAKIAGEGGASGENDGTTENAQQ